MVSDILSVLNSVTILIRNYSLSRSVKNAKDF